MFQHRGLLLVLLLGAGTAAAQPQVMQEALKAGTPAEENLRVLTDEIGGRITGTAQLDKAADWALAAFREAGADAVYTETFALPRSWAEGETEVDVVAPAHFHVRAQAVAWTPPLSATTARVVDIGQGSTAEFASAGDISGAILLVHSNLLKSWDDLFEEYFRCPAILDSAVKGKALAVAFTSTREHHLLYQHINSITGRIDIIPQVLLSREDSLRIQRLIAHGENVTMSLAIPNVIGPAVTSRNVIAQLTGAELPNEAVILGAHLDSWNLGTGALDNGCNVALVIDALRAIKAAGARPRRTIRFILFSGEEQGLFGSLAYVRAHRGEMDKIAAVVVLDAGDGAITGFSTGGRRDVDAALAPLLQPFTRWKATGITDDAELGTDNFDFMLEGVPTILPNQEEGNYLVNYHASSDTYDKVDFPQLRKNEAITAELVLELANTLNRIGPRYTRQQIEATFPQTHLDDEMKGFRLWSGWVDGTRGREP